MSLASESIASKHAAARAAVESDTDDSWTQALDLDQEQILRAIDAALAFVDLIDVLIPA